MLNYDVAHWMTFLLAALVLNLAPGPDLAFILGHTARGGKRAGASAMFGIWTGAFAHVLLAVVGLSAIIATSAVAFSIVKWVGAAYLVWLGIRALFSWDASFLLDSKASRQTGWQIFRQGVLIDLLNPKVAIFFLAFLPQFVVADAGPTWLQLLVHGVLIIVVAALVEPPLVLLGDRLTQSLRANRAFGLWLERVLGAMLIGLGVKLATTSR